MSLLQALATYHNLGQQQITGEKIKLKSQAEPVRPTILNWLRYYRSELGIGYHNAVERGEFLYQSTNGRKLSPEERERINLVLKSIEEDLPLDVDPERQQIIFPKAALSAPSPAPRSPQISELAKPERISPVAVPAEVKPKFSAPRFASRPTLSHVPSQPSSEPSKQREMLKKQARPAAPSPDQSSAKDFSFVPASWKRSPRAIPVATGHLRFTAPHVFPVEHDQKESARETGQTPASGNAAVPRAPIPPVQPNKPPLSKAESDRAKAFAQPPQAPKRDPAPVPSVKPASGAPYRGPSRFNITPVGFTDDDEETVENT